MNLLFSLIDFKKWLLILGLIAFIAYYKITLELTKNELESAKSALNLALETNKANLKTIERLKKEHLKELESVKSANLQKENLNEKVKNAEILIQKADNNITRAFNTLLDGLWEQDASSAKGRD